MWPQNLDGAHVHSSYFVAWACRVLFKDINASINIYLIAVTYFYVHCLRHC